jgi:hypothetical protein
MGREWAELMNYARRIFLAAAVALSLTQCSALKPSGGLEHVVLMWLKRPGNEEDRAKVIAVSRNLKEQIREVKRISVGRVIPSDRPVVDDSFDVAMVMLFRSPEELAAYQKHPVHEKAVAEVLKPLTSKIVVHDFTVE